MGVERIEVRRFPHPELEAGVVHGAIDGRPALRPIALDDDRPIAPMDRLRSPKLTSFSMAMNNGSRSAHAHPLFPIAAQRSKSNGAPRAAIVALIIDVPPTRRPRGTRKLRPPNVPAPSVLTKSQSNSGIPPAPRQWCSPLKVNSGGTVFLLREVRPGLEQQDAARGVFDETRRDDAAARSRADNNDVVTGPWTLPKVAT